MTRKKLYQLINIAKNQLGIDDDSYRCLLVEFGAKEKQGKISLTTLSDKKLKAVFEFMKDKGFEPKKKYYNEPTHLRVVGEPNPIASWPINTKDKTWRGPLIRKIVAQWNDLANQGKVRSRTLAACRSYCSKQTGIDKLEWFTKHDFQICIEGLKAWQQR